MILPWSEGRQPILASSLKAIAFHSVSLSRQKPSITLSVEVDGDAGVVRIVSS